MALLLLLLGCSGGDDGKETGTPAPPPLDEAGVALRGDAGDLAGSALGAGDLDGDGAQELIVGALGGRVACVVAPPFDAADATLRDAPCLGQAEDYDFVGQAVAGGDLDGDGVGEVLIGAPGSDAGASDAGAAWLVTGLPAADAAVDTVATASWWGATAADGAGSAVAFAGDTDGDGVGDLLIGAAGSDLGGREGGAVYLVSGASSGSLADATAVIAGGGSDTSPTKHAEGVLGDGVGAAACGGDLDGDGLDDVAVGAPGWDGGGDNAGAVAIFLGPVAAGAHALDAADVLLASTRAGGYAGGALACGGDTDDDGAAELLAGADTDGGGRVYLWEGAGALEDGAVFVGADAEQAGYAVAFVTGGVAIGVASADAPETDAGGVVVLGGPFAAGTHDLADADARWAGEAGGDYAGTALIGLSDIDGAGAPGLAVGAPYNADPAPIGGAVYVIGGV